MQSLVRQKHLLLLGRGHLPLHKGQINVFIAAIKFISHNGMTDVGEVNSELVFAPGQWLQP